MAKFFEGLLDHQKSSAKIKFKQNSRRQSVQWQRRLQQQYDLGLVPGLTSEELDEFRQVFEFYDVNNSKLIDLKQLDCALRSLGYDPSKEDVENIVAIMDVDGDTTIDFSEFCIIIEFMTEQKEKYTRIREAFRCFDETKEGKISNESLLKHLQNQSMEDDQATALIRFADKKNRGYIDYETYISSMETFEKEIICSQHRKLTEIPSKNLETGQTSSAPYSNRKTSASSVISNKKNFNQEKSGFEPKKEKSCLYQENKIIGNVTKALGGPVLINAAVAITFQTQVRKKKIKWPTISRILNYKRKKDEKFKNLKVIEDDEFCARENESLLDQSTFKSTTSSNQKL